MSSMKSSKLWLTLGDIVNIVKRLPPGMLVRLYSISIEEHTDFEACFADVSL